MKDYQDIPQNVIDEWQRLGFTKEKLPLLFLLPLVQVAWAEGFLQASEQRVILQIAAERAVTPGHPAYEDLLRWFDERPSDEVFAATMSLIGKVMEMLPTAERVDFKEKLLADCLKVANASPDIGLFGGHNRLRREELNQLRELEERLYHPLKQRWGFAAI
jgi:hypothetical protein